jgi:hypothetical protein
MKTRSIALLPIVLFLLPACTQDSADVATGEMNAIINVEMGKESSDVSVKLREPGSGTVILSEGDVLTAKTDKDGELTLKLDDETYVSTIANDSSEITISLTRKSGESAPASTGKIPAPLQLDAPSAAMPVSYASGEAEFKWANPMEGANVYFFAESCDGITISNETKSGVSDTGSHKLPVSELIDAPPPAGGACVSVNIARIKLGTVDPAFSVYHGENEFEARRDDHFDIMIMP